MKYEKPDLEELELSLEGSFLAVTTSTPIEGGEGSDEDYD